MIRKETRAKPPAVPITDEKIQSYLDDRVRAELFKEKRIMGICREITEMKWEIHKNLEDTNDSVDMRSVRQTVRRGGRVRKHSG